MSRIEKTKTGNNLEETTNQRREFMGKAAVLATSVAVGSLVGVEQLFGRERSIPLNKQILFMREDGKVYTGMGLLESLGFKNLGSGIAMHADCSVLCGSNNFKIARPIKVHDSNNKTFMMDRCDHLMYSSSRTVLEKLKRQGVIRDSGKFEKIRK